MKERKHNRFLEVVAFILIILGAVSLAGAFFTNWATSIIYNEDYYLQVVSSLPKNSSVSNAISTYVIDKIFQDNVIQNKIQSLLPENLTFLAPSLTSEIQTRSYNLANKAVQSDAFSSLWVFTNSMFHKRVVAFLTRKSLFSQLTENAQNLQAKLQFDGNPLAQTVLQKITANNPGLVQKINNLGTISVDFFTKLQTLRQIVYWTGEFSSILPFIAAAFFLSAVALSYSRQTGILTTGIITSLAMLVEIILLRVLKTEFLNQFTVQTYSLAAQTVWDSFTADLIRNILVAFVITLCIAILASIFGGYQWAIEFREKIGITKLQKSDFTNSLDSARIKGKRFTLWFWIVGLLILLISFFVIQQITLVTVVIGISLLISYVSLVSIIFRD